MLLKYFYLGVFAGTCFVTAILGDFAETAPAPPAPAPLASVLSGMCVCRASYTNALCGCY